MQVVELVGQAREVADAVIVAVGKRLHMQLIDDGVLVPVLIGIGEYGGIDRGKLIHARHSSDAAEQQRRIAQRIDAKVDAAPFDRTALAGDQVLERQWRATAVRRLGLDPGQRQPEFLHVARQRDRHDDDVVGLRILLGESDDVAVLDRQKTQVARLQQRGVGRDAPGSSAVMYGLMLPGLFQSRVLISYFSEFEILFAAGNRLVLEQFEAVVDAVVARQRRGEREARLEHPRLAALQVPGKDIRRADEEIRPVVVALGIAGQFVQVRFDLPLLGSPGEVGVRLREAELRQALHQLRPREGFGEEDHAGIARLHLVNQPLPEIERLGVRVVDAEDAHARDRPRTG